MLKNSRFSKRAKSYKPSFSNMEIPLHFEHTSRSEPSFRLKIGTNIVFTFWFQKIKFLLTSIHYFQIFQRDIYYAPGGMARFEIDFFAFCSTKLNSKRRFRRWKRAELKEETLNFSKHQKLLILINYSRSYKRKCDGVS